MPFLPLDILEAGSAELNIDLSEEQLDKLDAFASLLVETNEQFNLTRITDPEDIVFNHYLDSLLCLWALDIPSGAMVIDVGTGAGFPGVPVAIARPDLKVVLLDSTAKKVHFLEEAASKLGLTNVEPLFGRAEDLARDKAYRERYDLVTARALSELKILAELCVPLVRVGGRVIASKGPEIEEELTDARPIIGQLGAMVEKTVRTHIPATDVARQMIVLIKSKPTPAQFPRAYAQISRQKGRREAVSR